MKGPSSLERDFSIRWSAVKGAPSLVREHQFHPKRKWRFDFANVIAKVAIELEGGVYTGGRHTKGAGYEKDCEKYNEAQMLGWVVLRVTTGMLQGKNGGWELLNRMAQFIQERIGRL